MGTRCPCEHERLNLSHTACIHMMSIYKDTFGFQGQQISTLRVIMEDTENLYINKLCKCIIFNNSNYFLFFCLKHGDLFPNVSLSIFKTFRTLGGKPRRSHNKTLRENLYVFIASPPCWNGELTDGGKPSTRLNTSFVFPSLNPGQRPEL